MKQFLLLVLLSPVAALAADSFVPASVLRFETTPQELLEDCRAAKKRAESALEAVARMPEGLRTFDNTPWAIDQIGADLSDQTASNTFLKYVSISSTVRDAGNECETLLGQFSVDMYSREDLYRALKEYKAKGEALTGESKRLVDKELLDFKRSGLELPKEERQAVIDVRKKLVELEATFGKNINEHKDYALFDESELGGLPADFVARLERVDGKFKVGLDYPDYFPFMENSTNAAARRVMEGKFNNRASVKNLPLLKEVLAQRLKAARLLGYKTHSHFILEDRMAKDPGTVASFIARLRKKLKVLGNEELKTLKALKSDVEGRASDGKFHAWDWRFYDNQLKKTKYAVDNQKIKEYFPVDHVTEQMLGVYQTLLGLKFRQIKDAAVWHPDVKLYEINDAAGGEPIAYFYMDLFPREGKYKHAAAFSLLTGRQLPDGRYQKPVSSMVANFNKSTKDRPSLLTHDEVETFFHEFGHIMHQTLTKAKYGRFAGSATARDFVEAPSQMLENWVWEREVLQSLSGHYLDRTKKLPNELLGKMLAAKNVNSGLVNLRQLLFGAVDQLYHGNPPSDTTEAYARLAADIAMIPTSEGSHPEASFGHLMGYDAGYYGYMWSKVYAEDMFSKFKEGGVLNPALGRRYRVEILEKGSSRDEMDSLKAFLGREPNEDAFLESIGLNSAPVVPAKLTMRVTFRDAAGSNILAAGGTASLAVDISNAGPGTARDVSVAAHIEGDSAITVPAEASLGTILPGKSASHSIELEASQELTAGEARIKIEVREANGFDATPKIVLFKTQAFKAPKLEIVGLAIDGGVVRAGEVTRLEVTIKNTGAGPASNLAAALDIKDRNIFPSGGTSVKLETLEAGGTTRVTFDFVVNNRFTGKALPIGLDLSEASGKFGASIPLNLSVGEAAPSPQIVTVKATTPTPRVGTDEGDLNAPPYKIKERPSDFALVVGIDKYQSLPGADFADRDATAVRTQLIAMGVPQRNIVFLTRDKATRSNFASYIEEWLPKNVKPESKVFVYFSGHGAPDPQSGDAYLVPWDGNPQFLQTTAYPLKQLYAALTKLKSTEVIVALDACFSGVGGRSVLAKGARPLVAVNAGKIPEGNLTVFSAAANDEITGSLDEARHGIFTYHFLRGLNGAAKDSSGRITTKGLHNYLTPHVQEDARRQNREQTPSLAGAGERVLVQLER